MPDRRQGDRRESSQSFANKQIKISLGTFIFLVIFIISLIIATISCIVVAKIYYNKGYEQGIIDTENSRILQEYYNNVEVETDISKESEE